MPLARPRREAFARCNALNQAARRKTERFISHLEPIQPPLAAYCRRALNDPDQVADALQSAIVNAFRDFDLYAEGTNFRAWMFRYVSYEVLNRNRAATRRRAAPAGDIQSEPGVGDQQAPSIDVLLDEPQVVLDQCDEVVAQAVLDLPDTQRSILLLRAIGDFKYREIAEILDVPVGTVMGLLSRSRERLRHLLYEYARNHGLLK